MQAHDFTDVPYQYAEASSSSYKPLNPVSDEVLATFRIARHMCQACCTTEECTKVNNQGTIQLRRTRPLTAQSTPIAGGCESKMVEISIVIERAWRPCRDVRPFHR